MYRFWVPLVASVALNTLAFTSVGNVFKGDYHGFERIRREQRLAAEKDKIFFDFVESPSLERAQKPDSAKKISDRDSVSRDSLKTRPQVTDGPKIKNPGPADQLAQLQLKPATSPTPASKASREARQSPEVPPSPEPKERKIAEAPKPTLLPEGRTPEPAAKDEVVVPATAEPEPPSPKPSKASPVDSPKQAASPAQPGQRQPADRDKITTQEMTKARQRGARLTGMTSFDAMGSDMGVYMSNLKEKIWLSWFPYLSFQYPTDYQGADAQISILLDAAGKVKSLQVLTQSGSPQFAEFCLTAIQRAGSFGRVPPEILALLGKDQIEIKFAFHYR